MSKKNTRKKKRLGEDYTATDKKNAQKLLNETLGKVIKQGHNLKKQQQLLAAMKDILDDSGY